MIINVDGGYSNASGGVEQKGVTVMIKMEAMTKTVTIAIEATMSMEVEVKQIVIVVG